MDLLRRTSWSPYLVGALIGVLSWFTFASVDRPLGITTAFEYTAALTVEKAAPATAKAGGYFADADKTPKIDWEWMLVVGVFIGAWISSTLSGDRDRRRTVPESWARRFGPSPIRRAVGAFVGGTMLMLGARIAQGCTSGHGISGALQLAVSSWLFVAVFAITAVATAFAIYGPPGDDDGRVD